MKNTIKKSIILLGLTAMLSSGAYAINLGSLIWGTVIGTSNTLTPLAIAGVGIANEISGGKLLNK